MPFAPSEPEEEAPDELANSLLARLQGRREGKATDHALRLTLGLI